MSLEAAPASVLDQLGEMLTLRHVLTVGSEDLEVRGTFAPVDDDSVDGVTVLRTDRMVYVAAEDVGSRPEADDWFLLEGDRELRIADIQTWRVRGADVLYVFRVRS